MPSQGDAAMGGVRLGGGMEIERVDVAGSPQIVGACYEILRTAQPVDDPDGPPISRRMFERWMEKSWNGDPQEMWVALGEGDDGVVGWYLLHLPAADNLHMASFNVTVRQDRLRQGLGTALLRHGAARALDERRSLIHSWARDGSRGEAFARSRGATGGIAQLRRVLELDAAAADRLGELRAAAESAAAGYRLVSWISPTPEEYLDQVAALHNALADAPHDASWHPPSWDAERIRKAERWAERRGIRMYTVAAWHEGGGELGGLTEVGVEADMPDWGFQELTAVARGHRGHRLGLLLKIAMQEWLAEAEPQLRRILTGNAGANEHMIAINEALGYQLSGSPFRSWEFQVADLV
jgi:RimJ/RimL family protein N-acetyltransferase